MISRTTDDYEAMAANGIVALIEPAFWIGQPRTNVGSYIDYLSSIIGFERFRAGQFGIRHYCTIGLNSKEANNEELAEGVMDILPRFALKDGVVAIGEIGYDEQTDLEDKYYRLQLELAKELDLPVMIHTPHRDKKRGTTRSMDVCEEHGVDPAMVVVDHNNEETVQEVLDPIRRRADYRGFRLRLGYFRTARRAQDGQAGARARHPRGARAPCLLQKRPRCLRPQRADARGRLAQSARR
jgi:predicted metal-dependent TIM-barrel fold hydrolase